MFQFRCDWPSTNLQPGVKKSSGTWDECCDGSNDDDHGDDDDDDDDDGSSGG